MAFLRNPFVDYRFLESITAAEAKVRDSIIFDEPIQRAGVAVEILGKLF